MWAFPQIESRCERPRRAGCRPIEAPAFDFIEGHVGQSLAGRCTGPSGHTGAQAGPQGNLPGPGNTGQGAGARPTGAALGPR